MNHFEELRRKIENRQAVAGVVGLGYVGLPLAVELAHAGFNVVGIDVLASKVDAINRGESYVQDVPTSVLQPLVKAGKIRATTDFAAVGRTGHHQHRRAHAAAQNQRPGHELHRQVLRGHRQAFSRRDCW